MFDIAERKRWLKRLKMLSLIGATRVDFLRKGIPAMVASLVLIVVGMGSLVVRGEDNLDIDFTGGTMVTFEFVKPQEIEDVRGRLQEKFGGNMSLEQLTLAAEQRQIRAGTRYRLRTTIQEPEEVRKLINESFPDEEHALRRVTMSFSSISDYTPQESTGENETTTADEQARFAGGHTVHLTFSGGVARETISEYVIKELNEITVEGGAPKYDEIPSLFKLVGRREAPADPNDLAAGTPRWLEMDLFASPDLARADLEAALKDVETRMASEPVYTEVNTFDSSVAGETQVDALIAIILSLIAMIIYIWFRFERVTYGLAAIIAIAHDVLVTIGCLALAAWLSPTIFGTLLDLEDFKINLAIVAAIMTIVGYSVNDTIVIFDRIREIRGKNPNLTYDMVNLSVNQTLARTLLTSLTTLIVCVILYIFGGEGIHGFAFCMVVGVIAGSYSTIFIANPILLWLTRRQEPRKAMA